MEMEIKDAELLRLQPGDLLVVTIDAVLPQSAVDRVKEKIERKLAQNGIEGIVPLVLSSGATISIIRPDVMTEDRVREIAANVVERAAPRILDVTSAKVTQDGRNRL